MRTAVILVYTCWMAGVHVPPTLADSNMLNSIVGEEVIFRVPVKETGFIFKDDNSIAKVVDHHSYITNINYSGRLHWSDITGFFAIPSLWRNDSGKYRVQNNDGTNIYQLTVWDPVPIPRVSSRNKKKPTCSVLCSVENGREVTLFWQREGKTLAYSNSSSTSLSLQLQIEYNSAPYSCVAKNPARTEKVTIKPEEFCFDSVSKPRITSTAAEGYQGRYCSLLCSVENGREVTLSWQREGETLSHTSSPDLSSLTLLLEIKESNITYSCVAKNPISEERTVFYPSQHCREKGGHSHDAVVYIVLVLRLVEFVLVTLAVLLLIRLYREGRVLTQHQHR
ncbi:hypothetical protein AGOR_G00194970 [Albula goreensis]|uniref:Ig-like domain-containing protein n=1 Tax=Albula goreensis TaxID=1534307 RepID=A0A8T3CW59_9TELE|nr:hypothetical protein AGOR_G00194970 [Albula goreensis]